MTLSECITAVKDALVGLSAVSAAVFAYLGLTTWRKELKGKSEYQLAKEVLKSVYKVREAFKHVRNPWIYQYEYPNEMLDDTGHLKREQNYEGTAHVYEKRWEMMTEAFRELEEHHLEAQVEWGSEFQDVITKLRSCKVDLLIAIQQMLEHKKNPREIGLTDAEKHAEERSVLYYHGSDSKYDKFTPQIDEAINEFEKWLRPHIKR
jgi:hypothetical protein